MPKANRRCSVCGKEYYVCFSCVSKRSWKHLACSPECYRKLMKKNNVQPQIIDQESKEEKKVLLKVKTKGKKLRNIIGYDIESGRFDCDDNETTLAFSDIEEFLVPREEMENIFKIINDCKNGEK